MREVQQGTSVNMHRLPRPVIGYYFLYFLKEIQQQILVNIHKLIDFINQSLKPKTEKLRNVKSLNLFLILHTYIT